MSYNNFKKDLLLGESYEYKFINIIPNDRYIKKEGNFKPYDLEVYHNDIKTTYEVKACNSIMYIPIEYRCYNKPSGIKTSEADKWVIFDRVDNDLYIIPTEIIKEYIDYEMYNYKRKGGDYNSSKMYLFSKGLFNDYKYSKF